MTLVEKNTKKTFINFRKMLHDVFMPDTSAPGAVGVCPSAGHCAAVAIVVNQLYGGTFRSTVLFGRSHWYNRVDGMDIDLTGDQFGYPTVNYGKNIYSVSLEREPKDLNDETINRAELLAKRLGFSLGRFNAAN